jgi:hypothetical protein
MLLFSYWKVPIDMKKESQSSEHVTKKLEMVLEMGRRPDAESVENFLVTSSDHSFSF